MKVSKFKLEDYLSSREFSAKHNFCSSDMQTMPLQDLLEMAPAKERTLWNKLSLGYTEPQGHPLLREQIASLYENSIEKDNILCFAGAEEGIYTAINSLLTAADHAIVITPCYESLINLPQNLCETTEIKLDYENQWQLSVQSIEENIRKNTKMIVINFPHNPTGSHIDAKTQQALIDVAKKNNIWLFADEVYRGLEIDENQQLPHFASCYEKALSLGVMSKSYGLAGLRIGWIACQNRTILQDMLQFKYYLSICNSAPAEILALIALQAGNMLIRKNRKLLLENYSLLQDFFAKYPNLFEWRAPAGGCIAFPRLKSGENADVFADKLLQDANILILPGSLFNMPQHYFRIGYGREDTSQTILKLEKYINNIMEISHDTL